MGKQKSHLLFHQNHKTAMINATEFLENLRSLQVVENEGGFKCRPKGIPIDELATITYQLFQRIMGK